MKNYLCLIEKANYKGQNLDILKGDYGSSSRENKFLAEHFEQFIFL